MYVSFIVLCVHVRICPFTSGKNDQVVFTEATEQRWFESTELKEDQCSIPKNTERYLLCSMYSYRIRVLVCHNSTCVQLDVLLHKWHMRLECVALNAFTVNVQIYHM